MNLKTLAIFVIFIMMSSVDSSEVRVFDRFSHKKLYVSHYCPKIANCEEGTHIVCLYYNPKRKMGPGCHNNQNVSMTGEYATKILEILNGIRSQVSRGLATGQDGQRLPRGYGIIKLEWDEELATFAQLWANQCTQGTDYCRATSKFPDAGQMVGVNRFQLDWSHVTGRIKFRKLGFSKQKERYALVNIIKSWYITAQDVLTPERVKNEDSTPAGQRDLDVNHFMNMFSGAATHVGCGMSAYTEYVHDTVYLRYNNIRMVCNLSTRLIAGKPIYNTDPPTEAWQSPKCGCPPRYDEDEDCLCYRNTRKQRAENPVSKPSVVILPIFNVEEPPSEDPVLKPWKQNSNRLSKCDTHKKDKNLGTQNLNFKNNIKFNYNEKDKLDRNIVPNISSFGLHNKKKDYSSLSSYSKIKKIDSIGKVFPPMQKKSNIAFDKKEINNHCNKNIKSKPNQVKNKTENDNDKEINQQFHYSNSNRTDSWTKNYIRFLTDENIILLLDILAQELDDIVPDSPNRGIINEKVKNIYNKMFITSNPLEYNYLEIKDQRNEYNNNYVCNVEKAANTRSVRDDDADSDDLQSNFNQYFNNNENQSKGRSDSSFPKFRKMLDIRQNNGIKSNDDSKVIYTQDLTAEDLLNYEIKNDYVNILDNVEEELLRDQILNLEAGLRLQDTIRKLDKQ